LSEFKPKANEQLTSKSAHMNAEDELISGVGPTRRFGCFQEVAGDLSKPAQIEARSPSIGKNKAVTRPATALFMPTAPHGSTNKVMEVAIHRLDRVESGGRVGIRKTSLLDAASDCSQTVRDGSNSDPLPIHASPLAK
jgi:hypothetical protein